MFKNFKYELALKIHKVRDNKHADAAELQRRKLV